MDQKFHKYPAGTVTNPLTKKLEKPELTWREIKLKYPSRLNAMAIDPSKDNQHSCFTGKESH
jgi:hypothetical protein